MADIVLPDKSPQLIYLIFELVVLLNELIDPAVEHNQCYDHRNQTEPYFGHSAPSSSSDDEPSGPGS